MITSVTTVQHAKDLAKTKKSNLEKLKFEKVSVTTMLELISWEHGYKNWNSFKAHLEDKDKDKGTRIAQLPFYTNPNTCTEAELETLTKLAADEDWTMRARVAVNCKTPVELLEKLSKDVDVSYKVAVNPNTPKEILIAMFEHDYSGLAKNPNTPVEVLQKIFEEIPKIEKEKENKNSPYFMELPGSIRESLAANPNTPKEILKSLSKCKDYWVRSKVALNPNTPIEPLAELMDDDVEYVRDMVALNNPKTPVKLLTYVSKTKPSIHGY